MSKATVGFIGTGLMGEPMARHVLKAGYPLRVWNRSAEKLQGLVAAGAQQAATARDAAQGVSVLVSMLSDGPTTDAVLFGEAGVVPAMGRDAIAVVMSSIPVQTAVCQSQRCAEFGVRYLDAPVSGGTRGAQQGTLAIMAGGTERDFIAVHPVLAAMGRPVLVGPVGSGELSKLANQLIVAGTIAAVSEAILLAEHGGADPAKVREALTGGFADSAILQQHGKRMIDGDFRAGGPAKYQLKDTNAILDCARSLGISLPVASLVHTLFEEMVSHGDGDLDHSGLIRELRRRNGLPVEKPK